MKICIIIFVAIFLSSCNSSEEYRPKKSKDIPNALQEKSVDVNVNKSKDTDLIENLYKELIEKDRSLAQLEKEINKLQESKDDSLKAFTLYDHNNKEYYKNFQNHLGEIQDSLLRKRMKKILDSSIAGYETKILKQQKVFDSTNDMYRSLSDLHWLLKLSKTLDVIKNYQNKNLPDTATLKQTMIELNNAIKKTDSLLKEMQHQRSQMHKE